VSKGKQFVGLLKRTRWAVVFLAAGVAFSVVVWWLRNLPYSADPLLYAYLELMGSLIAFTYAANTLVRFKGTHDRISLILAFGFVLSGLIEMVSSLSYYGLLNAGPFAQLTVPLAWMVSRTLLAVLLVAALAVEKYLPTARDPDREIAVALLVVGAVAYLTSAAYLGAATVPTIWPGVAIPRPWELLPAMIFLVAVVGYRRRLRFTDSAFDRVIWVMAALNVLCHLAASQSQGLLDAPFAFAHIVEVSSYALVLGGALLDNARMFDHVRHLAASDPLTGLANYRRLVAVLDAEIQRSRRTKRAFAVLLLDLDGLKSINDRYGHLVGSRALRRLADVLRVHCRSIDTAARYGGDEFALVLPEAGEGPARRVARRICERLADDGLEPQLSVSVGVAVYPTDGKTIEKLLNAADQALYRMKSRGGGKLSLANIAACL